MLSILINTGQSDSPEGFFSMSEKPQIEMGALSDSVGRTDLIDHVPAYQRGIHLDHRPHLARHPGSKPGSVQSNRVQNPLQVTQITLW